MAVNLRRVDLNLLNIFSVLAAECNLTVAAKQLNMTQPAVSMALQRLRTLYNDPLLVRKGRYMELTPKATLLKTDVEKALNIISATLPDNSAFDPINSKVNYKLNLFRYSEQLLVPKFLEQLSNEAPNSTLTITTNYNHNPEKLLRNREVDIYVNFEPIDHPDYFSTLLYREKLVVVTRKNHSRLENKTKLTMEDFLQEKHAVYTANENIDFFTRFIVDENRSDFDKRNIVYSGSSELGVMSLVSSTDIISIVPESLVYLLSDIFEYKFFEPPIELYPFETYLNWYSGHEHEQQHRWLRKFILASSNEWVKDIDNRKSNLK